MALTLELIQILDAIDRFGSFEAAANVLHKVRSALTYNIRTYEKATNIQLFDRGSYRAQLTPAGKLLLKQGRELLFQSRQIEQDIKQVSAGYEPILRIAYDEVLNPKPILELLKAIQQQHPNVNFEIFSEVLGGCSEALSSRQVDIAIGISGRLAALQEMSLEILGKIKWVFAIPANHPLSEVSEPISINMIASFARIFARDSANRFSQEVNIFNSSPSSITFTSLEMKKQAQIMGLGVGFLPHNLIKQEIKDKKLLVRKVEKQKPDSQFYLGWDPKNEGKLHKLVLDKLRDKKFQRKLFQ